MLNYRSNLKLTDAHHLDVAEKLLHNTLVLKQNDEQIGVKLFFSELTINLKKLYMDEKEVVFLDCDKFFYALEVLIYDMVLMEKNFDEKVGETLLELLQYQACKPFCFAWLLKFYDGFHKLCKEAKNRKVKLAIKEVLVLLLNEIRSTNAPMDCKMFVTLCRLSPNEAFLKLDNLVNHNLCCDVKNYEEVLEVLDGDEVSEKIARFLICNNYVCLYNSIASWYLRVYPDTMVDKEIEIAFMRSVIKSLELNCYIETDEYIAVVRPFLLNAMEPQKALNVLCELLTCYLVDYGNNLVVEIIADMLDIIKRLPRELQLMEMKNFLSSLKKYNYCPRLDVKKED